MNNWPYKNTSNRSGSDITIYVSLFTSRLWRTSRTAYQIRKHSSLIDTNIESRENEIRKLLMLILLRKLRKEAMDLATSYMQRLP